MKKDLMLMATLTLLMCGCVSPPSAPVEPDLSPSRSGKISGDYSYSAYDNRGTKVVEGTMRIRLEDSARISGSWEFRSVTDSPTGEVGPQKGSGTLVGDVHLSLVGINLNPNYADNNVVLFGTFDGSTILGNWQFVGFPGVLNQGTFRAVRAVN